MQTKPRPKRCLTKSRRVLPSKQAAVTPASSAASGENRQSATATLALPQADAQTQAAVRLFLRQIGNIADARIVRRGNGEIYQQAFTVEVPDLWSEAADQVYTLRGDVYRKYPASQLEIEICGRREFSAALSGTQQGEER